MAREIANRLRVSSDHISDLIDEGILPEESTSRMAVSRRTGRRVSVVNYRTFLAWRISGRTDFAAPPRFDYPSLEFPTPLLTLEEIARRFMVSTDHLHDAIAGGELCAIDVRGAGASRGLWRVPIEAYRYFVATHLMRPRQQGSK